jgi:hypothetical protein
VPLSHSPCPFPQPCLIAEALKSLSHAEAEAKKRAKSEKKKAAAHRFPTAIEWELLHADAIIILGLIDAMRYGALTSSFTSGSLTRSGKQPVVWWIDAVSVFSEQVRPLRLALHYVPAHPHLISAPIQSSRSKSSMRTLTAAFLPSME